MIYEVHEWGFADPVTPRRVSWHRAFHTAKAAAERHFAEFPDREYWAVAVQGGGKWTSLRFYQISRFATQVDSSAVYMVGRPSVITLPGSPYIHMRDQREILHRYLEEEKP